MTKKKELCRVKFMKMFEDSYYDLEQKNIILKKKLKNYILETIAIKIVHKD